MASNSPASPLLQEYLILLISLWCPSVTQDETCEWR